MGRGRAVLLTLVVASLVTACSSGADGEAAGTGAGDAGPGATTTTASIEVTTTAVPAPTTAASTVATSAPTTPAPVTPAPTAATPPPPVASPPGKAESRKNCTAAPEPPADAKGLQATFLDVDGDDRSDTVWLYDAPDGTHLHLRTGRGVTDDFVLGYGDGAVSVGSAQVDLAVGSESPGTPQEILAVTSDGDGRRLVGIYGFVIRTGCVEPFLYAQGSPFVYLVSRTGTVSSLECANDGVTGRLVGTTATETAAGDFATTRLTYKRDGRKLVPDTSQSGQVSASAMAGLAATTTIACNLSSPPF